MSNAITAWACQMCGGGLPAGVRMKPDRKYCGMDCRNEAYRINPPRERNRVTRQCENCSAEFTVAHSQVVKGGGRFCSKKCYSATGGVMKACEGCGDAMVGPPSLIKNRRFCNWECRTKHLGPTYVRPKYAHTCKHCGLVRMIGKKRMDRPYCSVACRNADYKINPTVPRKQVNLTCEHCSSQFSKSHSQGKRSRFCSKACMLAALAPKFETVQCQHCGSDFSRNVVSVKKFCSRACAYEGHEFSYRPSRIALEASSIIVDAVQLLAVSEMRIGRWSIDLAFPIEMIALELDGCYWHAQPKAIERDARKDLGLARLGWNVARVTISSTDTPESVASKAIQALEFFLRQ